MKLSIILPSIRPFLLDNFYKSLLLATKDKIDFELLVISPFKLPDSLINTSNIKLIHDMGSPARALQIGLINATGDYITTASDDSTFYEDAYIKAITEFEKLKPPRRMLVLKFQEGSIGDHIRNEKYHFFQAKFHADLNVNGLPDNTPMALGFIIDKQTLIDIGGWDCITFQDGNWGGHDLIGRLMNLGIEFSYMDKSSYHNLWSPGPAGMFGDHTPIWESSNMDMPIFKSIWNQTNNRIKINIDNWKQAPAKWPLRYKNEQ